jgi:hypothetical protein
VLKATLATDAVIGSSVSIRQPGSGYVLLHHVMGQAGGRAGTWAYAEGGMGAVTQAMLREAEARGVTVVCDVAVKEIAVADAGGERRRGWGGEAGAGAVKGVVLADGRVVEAETVISNATPYHTVMELMASDVPGDAPRNKHLRGGAGAHAHLPESYVRDIRHADAGCGAMKINCAVDRLPDFLAMPNREHNREDGRGGWLPGPQHFGTIHFEESFQGTDGLLGADFYDFFFFNIHAHLTSSPIQSSTTRTRTRSWAAPRAAPSSR